MKKLKNILEWHLFGVCSSIGEYMGVSTLRIRLWFIYLSFLTMGSPILFYLVLGFLQNLRRYILLEKRNPLKWQ